MTKKIAFKRFDCLLPNKVSLDKWAVIACDQYTSSEDYWNSVKNFVGDDPSTLNIVLPEIYIQKNNDECINRINNKMIDYINSDLFTEYKDCYIYIERTISNNKVRKGIIGICDLEQYDADSLNAEIMPSEQVVIERVPSRKKIRENAKLETSHTILFINDKKDLLFNYLSSIKEKLTKLYDFDLMKDGGHICGYLVVNEIADKFDELYKDYVLSTEKTCIPQLLVGDGNHSMLAAKEIYKENLKNDKLRYSMVEIQNIYDEAIEIKPIHRVLFDINKKDFISYLEKNYKCNTSIKWLTKDEEGILKGNQIVQKDVLDELQPLIDEYLRINSGYIDYIHDNIEEIVSKKENSLGLIIPSITKDNIFKRVFSKGVYQRKTFSIGTSNDKRYYLEMRKIY